MSDRPWMPYMHSHLGEHETLVATGHSNPFIDHLFTHTTYGRANDTVPWCAATVDTALEENGYLSTHSAAAVSFVHYGTSCALTPGCIVVLQHHDGSHHVTFCEAIKDVDYFVGLGGNQSNQIKCSTYPRNQIIACRWPVKKGA